MTTTLIITGNKAIEIAGMFDSEVAPTLNKSADPIEGERLNLTVAEAQEIANEDPSLIWINAAGLREAAGSAGDLDMVALIDAAV
jgi:hypothetical protein